MGTIHHRHRGPRKPPGSRETTRPTLANKT